MYVQLCGVELKLCVCRAPRTERRPPLGHEATSAPLTAPALVKMQVKEVAKTPEPAPEEQPAKPPTFLRHKDSVDLIATPDSPVLTPQSEERPFLRHTDSVDLISPPDSPKPSKPGSEERPFLRHKDSVDLISPPDSPRLKSKTEERPAPIGKVGLVTSSMSLAFLPCKLQVAITNECFQLWHCQTKLFNDHLRACMEHQKFFL